MNVLEKIVAYLLMTAGIFIVPAVMVLSQNETTKDTYVYSISTKFISDCSTSGQISPEDYNILTNSIYGIGDYTVYIEYESEQAYARPDGTTEISSLKRSSEEIIGYMFSDPSNERAFPMKCGDYIGIKVKKNSRGVLEALERRLRGSSYTYKELIVNYYMMVGESSN